MGKLFSLAGGMQEIKIPQVQLGQIVRYNGDMANPSGIGAVVEITGNEYGPYTLALDDGREIRACMLHGNRYEIQWGEIASPDHIEILKAGVQAAKAAEQARTTSAKQIFAAAVERIKQENPHLIQGGDCVTAAKNIRSELKREFPGITFSVKTRKFSGGNSIDVHWTDGPTTEQVKNIINKYSDGHFDGMTDCYEYKSSPWNETFGASKYIMWNRHYSDAAITSAIRRLCARFGLTAEIPAIEDYKTGNMWRFNQSGIDMQREMHRALERHTYTIGTSQRGISAACA
jgi:hypothetical protein